MAIGIVAKDKFGHVRWMWRSRVGAVSAMEAEMNRDLITMLLAKFRTHHYFLVEGDKAIMDALAKNGACSDWSCTPLFNRILSLSDWFSECVFKWVHRACNDELIGYANGLCARLILAFVC